jgi:hypothetical protein
VFLASFGLERNLDKSAALVEAHNLKMSDLVKDHLEKGNVFIAGVNFGQSPLDLIKSNKGFIDTGNTRTAVYRRSVGNKLLYMVRCGKTRRALTAVYNKVLRADICLHYWRGHSQRGYFEMAVSRSLPADMRRYSSFKSDVQ